MTATMTSLKVGDEVRRDYSIPARYLGLPPGAPSKAVFDLGTVVDVKGERVQVYWHTYRADLPAGVCKTKSKRTWIKAAALAKAS
jgi:hypothetical protein